MNNQEEISRALVHEQRKTLAQRIEEADELMLAITEIKSKVLKYTKPNDWTNQSGKPFLNADACLEISQPYGIEIYDAKHEPMETIVHSEGPPELVFSISAYVSIHGLGSCPALGSCSTRDDLLGKKGGKYKELHEINIPSVKKKAHTNMIGNAIRHILKLNNLSWDEWESLTGLKKEDLSSVNRHGQKDESTELSKDASEKLAEIRKMLSYYFAGDSQAAKAWLLKTTSFTVEDKETGEKKLISGKQDPAKLSEKQIIKIVYPKLKKEYDEMIRAESVGNESQGQ